MIFTIAPHSSADKRFEISGPDELLLEVDYDDVFHEDVDRLAERMVEVLNAHWEEHA